MSEKCKHDCSTCGRNCAEREKKSHFEARLNAASNVGTIIAVASGKGGVGKSMVTAMLAVAASKRGLRVGILDADITGPSIPKSFGLSGGTYQTDDGIEPSVTTSGIKVMSVNMLVADPTDPVVWRGPVITGAVMQFWTDVHWGDLDVMFVDMPPGTGDVPLTVFQSLPVNGVVIVTSPQDLVELIVSKSVKMAQMMKKPVVGLVENMSYLVCPDCGKKITPFGESKIEELSRKYSIPSSVRIPITPSLAAAVDAGASETVEMAEFDAFAAQILAASQGR